MKDLKISSKEKLILISMMATPLLLLFCWIFFNSITDKRTGKEIYLNHEINTECMGKIDSVYRLKMNHNTLTLNVSGDNFYVPPEWENKFKINDSISKKKGSLKVEHYRKGNLLEILDYNNLVRR